MRFKEFIERCKDNDVWKNLSIYVVSSWVFLQVTDLISEPLGFTSKIVAYCLVFLLVCFPVFLFLLWKFGLSKSSFANAHLGEDKNALPENLVKKRFKNMYFSLIGIVTLISFGISSFILSNNINETSPLPTVKDNGKIAVLLFENLTGIPENDILGKMAVDWINHGITRNTSAQVISPKIIDDYSKVLRSNMGAKKNSMIKDYLNPSQIIEGEYYIDADRLIFQSSITDGTMNKTLISFNSISCAINDPLDCLEKLNQKIMGFYSTEGNTAVSLEEHPPNFDAYKLFQLALTFRMDNDSIYLQKLDEAIALDKNYFEPKIYRFMHYFNNGEYATADSLLQVLKIETGLHKRQRLLLNLYEALLQGKLGKAYNYQREEYNYTPFHLETNSNMMVFTLQFVNRPQGVDSIYKEINMKQFDLGQCDFCQDRFKIKALADIELGNHKEAIALLKPFSGGNDFIWLKKVLLRAYIRSGDFAPVKALLREYKLVMDNEKWTDLYLFSSKDLILVQQQDLANEILAEITKEKNGNWQGSTDVQESLFYMKDYRKALPLLQATFQEHPTNFYMGALLAISLYKTGNPTGAEKIAATMKNSEAPYQFGEMDYALGQYYAAINERQQGTQHLLKAIADGHWYETGSFQNDPLLMNVSKEPEFDHIMTYWNK